MAEAAESVPLLLLAAAPRSGSTLLQRLLSWHPDVLIWGEHAGQLPRLEVAERLRAWSAECLRRQALAEADLG